MEDSKSAASVKEEWRNNLRNAKNRDIFEIIKTAIVLAASNRPTEFQIRRDMIAQTLFFDDQLIKHSECDKCKNQSPDVSNEREDTLNTSVVLNEESRERSNSQGKPPIEKQIVPTCKQQQQQPTMVNTLKSNTETKFQIPKVNDDLGPRVYSQGVAEVLRMKKILERSGDESESVVVVWDLLTKLQSMELTMKTLETTKIGRTITTLKKHPSEKVRQIAVKLVKEWKRTVEEWIKKESNHVELKSQQVNPINLDMNTKRKLEGSEKDAKIGNGGVVESLVKFEATKRKMQEVYAKAENMKKRRTEVIELHEALLLPCIDGNRRKVNWRRRC
ncbi:unnamed protein product [Lactuca virosa]|uniref:TFIIS N-terminal domain-containing protein n=1 Tax=Lactuca virosa TaxID=75947 RepID=A0AAU9MDU7_9ASTR|nr:unnamed protein product [Lactuca virosa]